MFPNEGFQKNERARKSNVSVFSSVAQYQCFDLCDLEDGATFSCRPDACRHFRTVNLFRKLSGPHHRGEG